MHTPKGYHSVTPFLIIRDANRALDYYRDAFGAEVIQQYRHHNGDLMHGEIEIGDSRIMISEEQPSTGCLSPQALKNTPVSLYLYVKDVDAFVAKAVQAGCQIKMPIGDMFWGDRVAQLVDPFGHIWSIATHTTDVSEAEMQQRVDAFNASAPR